ncbi:MAG: aminopeptidase [Armatimonadota bacterium]
MKDPRYHQLAKLLIHHSTRIQPGEKILVEAFEIPEEFTCELIRQITEAGGLPFVETKQNLVMRELQLGATEEQLEVQVQYESLRMNLMDAYIGIRGTSNISETSDVPFNKSELVQRLLWHPVHGNIRVPKTKWAVLRWPSSSMAQQASTSTEAFEDFYFRVCTLDYGLMQRAVQPLVELMQRTDRVRIVGPGTDLSFSIAGMSAIPCCGQQNIPDGECFTAPIKESVEGRLQYNTPSLYLGKQYDGISFEFQNGKIVNADCANIPEELNRVLDSDDGARYVGEFSLGFNPFIMKPMKDTLFDEKIAGSFHFTPGMAYAEADNGNRSQVHWDLVNIQRPEYGGGQIYFDDKLIRNDGLFMLPELNGLNPEAFQHI